MTRWKPRLSRRPGSAAPSPSRRIWQGGAPILSWRRVAALGGLYVIGTNRHESRRIDNQLRGRAGRQGDPGCSRFFVSLEDPLMVKHGDSTRGTATIRLPYNAWWRASTGSARVPAPLRSTRRRPAQQNSCLPSGSTRWHSSLPVRSWSGRSPLRVIDDLWADYLARLEDFRAGIPWQSFAAVPGFFVGTD